MGQLNPGRMTHQHSGELVVFLIGMRINQPWRLDRWLPVFFAMPAMIGELMRQPDSGLMGTRLAFSSGGPWLVQYWNSQEKLYAYASDPTAKHRPAWARFNRLSRKAPGSVGVWHETYVVQQAETMYVAVPPTGLALATESIPAARKGDRAAERLKAGSTAA